MKRQVERIKSEERVADTLKSGPLFDYPLSRLAQEMLARIIIILLIDAQ